jgi:hypothetical protein
VLGHAAVVHGHHDGTGARGECVEVAVVADGGGRLDHEAPAVEVHDHGEILDGAGRRRRQVHADGGVGGGVDGDVLGGHAGGSVVEGGGDRVIGDEALDATALVEADERQELDGDLVGSCIAGSHPVAAACP